MDHHVEEVASVDVNAWLQLQDESKLATLNKESVQQTAGKYGDILQVACAELQREETPLEVTDRGAARCTKVRLSEDSSSTEKSEAAYVGNESHRADSSFKEGSEQMRTSKEKLYKMKDSATQSRLIEENGSEGEPSARSNSEKEVKEGNGSDIWKIKKKLSTRRIESEEQSCGEQVAGKAKLS